MSPKGVAVKYESNTEQATGGTTLAGVAPQRTAITFYFKAPHTLLYETIRADGTQQLLFAYVAPTSPGK